MAFDRIKKAIFPQKKMEVSESKNEKAENSKSDSKAMPRLELKHLAERLWRKPTSKEEKTPIISNGTKTKDHGSISKESSMNGSIESKSTYDSLLGSGADSGEDSSGPPRMTWLRKLCFLLSLNGGVVYVAALLWWIPCKHPLCLYQQNWTVNLSDQLTTNMEIKSTQLSSSVLFGLSDENGGKLASLAMANGTMGWNRSTENILKNVFCDLDSFADESNSIPDCVATTYNYIGAFNSSTGATLWEKNITGASDVTIRKVVLAGKPATGPFIMALSDEELFLFVAKNGSLLSMIDLPCSETVGLKLVGPWPTQNGTSWILVCNYGDSLEVWTFLEEEVLSLPEDSDEGAFRLLFSRGSSNGGSIDLAGDVTRTPNSLALSWADSVVMVTDQAPFHHLRKTWERSFGDTSVVTSLVSGRFTTPKEIQIAVTVKDDSNSSLHILESKNGTLESVTSLGMRSVMSMKRITGGEGGVDTLVIESTEEKKNSSSSGPQASRREYFTVKYVNKIAELESIVTLEAQSSILSQFAEGAADLLINSKSSGPGSIISRYVLISKHGGKCR